MEETITSRRNPLLTHTKKLLTSRSYREKTGEFAADGVTVNNLVPGVILTDRNEKILSDEAFRETVRSSVPLGRFGSVADMAGAALLLCSEAGAYITGIELPVTGGMHL